MSLIVIPNIFSVGQIIIASQHNANFSTIYSDYNGNITDVNLSASANISDTKLAQITTASKVNASALTSASSMPSGAGVFPIANLASGTPTGSKFIRDDGTLQLIGSLNSTSTASPSAVSSFTISSLTTGTMYKLILNLTQNTSNGVIGIRFNSDSGANYSFSTLGYNTAVINQNGSSQTSITVNSVTITASTRFLLEVNFSSAESNVTRCYGQYVANDTTALASAIFSGKYSGAAGLSSITILTSAGTITGTAKLYSLT